MPRKGPVSKSPVIADPVYNSPIVTALVNKVLLSGKRSTAEGIVYGALEGVRDKTNGIDPVITLKRALDNCLLYTSPSPRDSSMSERLTNELIDASNGLGAAVKKREDTHKMAEANKAFAHYRW